VTFECTLMVLDFGVVTRSSFVHAGRATSVPGEAANRDVRAPRPASRGALEEEGVRRKEISP